jgi:hypothetical protein
MVFAILPLAFVPLAAVFIVFGALAMFFAILQLANVLVAENIVTGALAMVLAILPLAFVPLAAIFIVFGALAMFFAIL